ncbi:hypothetical protein ACH79_28640 [Bradyrhizobium sp. CCBAU 051011]|nr:hypothetical protein ACH79_28640 [Bradyrhizobium sp. CCBAU 051011]
MKYAADRSYSLLLDPQKAARRLMEHAHAFEPIRMAGSISRKINVPFLFGDKGTVDTSRPRACRSTGLLSPERFAKFTAAVADHSPDRDRLAIFQIFPTFGFLCIFVHDRKLQRREHSRRGNGWRSAKKGGRDYARRHHEAIMTRIVSPVSLR